MKTYPKAIKTIIYTSTTLCAAVGIAVIAGASKAVRRRNLCKAYPHCIFH